MSRFGIDCGDKSACKNSENGLQKISFIGLKHSMRYNYLKALGVLWALCGCAPVVVHPAPIQKITPPVTSTSAPAYRIGAGDEIEIKFFSTPELDTVVPVRPDGMISMMFAQDVPAAGKTPEELVAVLKKKLAPHVKQPDMAVIMHSFASQKIYVEGEVVKPGPVQLSGRETLLQALGDAGWLSPSAKRDEVVLVRRGEDNKEAVYHIDVSKMVSGEDLSQNVMMQAGDLILVPPSDATSFDRWIDKNIRQALPFSTNAGVVYTNQYQPISR